MSFHPGFKDILLIRDQGSSFMKAVIRVIDLSKAAIFVLVK